MLFVNNNSLLTQNLMFLETTNLRRSIESLEFRGSAAALTISCFPAILDLLMDATSNTFLSSSFEERCDYIGRGIFAISTLLIGLQCSLSYGIFTGKVQSFVFALATFRIVSTSCLMFCICVAKPKLFTPLYTSTYTLSVALVAVIRTYTVATYTVTETITEYVAYLCTIFNVLSIGYLLIIMWKSRRTWNVEDFTALMYLSVVIAIIVGSLSSLSTVIIQLVDIDLSISQFTSFQVASVFFIYAFSIILFAIVPGRIARLKAVALKVLLLLLLLNFSLNPIIR
jgi:hypothetical protein